MSLDIGVRLGSLYGEAINITHNVHQQIVAAGADPWEYEDRLVGDTIEELRRCLAALKDPGREAELRQFDSPNGWGSLDSSRRFIAQLIGLAEAHPDCFWWVFK